MSTETFELNTFLSDLVPVSNGIEGSESDGTAGTKQPLYEAGYEGKIDYRIRQLSHSSLETFVTCPRKFQLGRLRTADRIGISAIDHMTFDFGHIVGDGIQRILQGQDDVQIYMAALPQWSQDIFEEDPKRAKSYWLALNAIEKFKQFLATGPLKEYELVYYNGAPACELSFAIHFPDGFRYRGFVDAVLRHKTTGKIVVLELKTTSLSTTNPSTYKNSRQAIGYSIVLDGIFPELSSYEVLYLVYNTKDFSFTPIPFTKSYLQRALWIKELLLDIETIKMYEEEQVYPMRGQNCMQFFKECEYINSCTLSTEYLKKNATLEDIDTTQYTINISLLDLLENQMEKTL